MAANTASGSRSSNGKPPGQNQLTSPHNQNTERETMKTRERLLLATAVTVCLNGWPSSARADALDVWNSRVSSVTNALNAAACGNGVCVVAGSAGLILMGGTVDCSFFFCFNN